MILKNWNGCEISPVEVNIEKLAVGDPLLLNLLLLILTGEMFVGCAGLAGNESGILLVFSNCPRGLEGEDLLVGGCGPKSNYVLAFRADFGQFIAR